MERTKEMNYKLGSLFDGSGGFPLAGTLCGIEPVWAAEVEPYPIAVTRERFPKMKHLGDIRKVNGADIEPVDIITFGSPCQDLSVAGKRAGLKHEANGDEETTRSGLFMEAVRIIKEMRKATNGMYPRFALWENVPGAFSSNKGEDFRIVCEELIKIVEPTASMPAVPQKGWNYADSYIGDGWSLAYRVFDAQYWGVPQRRRRIHLVADFRGECAREVLFEREGVRGYFETGRTPWQAVTGNAADRTGTASLCLNDQGGQRMPDKDNFNCVLQPVTGPLLASGYEKLGTQEAANGMYVIQPFGICSKDSNAMKSDNPHSGIYEANTSRTIDCNGGNPSCNQGWIAVVENIPYTVKIRQGCEGGGKGPLIQENKSATLATNNDQYLFQPVDFAQNQRDDVRDLGDKAGALQAEPGMKQQTFIAEPAAYDARGNGDGKTVNTLTGDHENRVTDYTSVVVYDGANVTSPVNASNPEPGCPCHTLGTDSRNYVVYESHPQDSLVKETGETSPTVAVKWHKGAADTPMVCMATQQGVAEIRTDDKCPTITASAGMSGNNQPVICLQGNCIDRADTASCNGKGWTEDTSYTLNTIDRPAVVYAVDQGGGKSSANVSKDQAPTICTTHGGEPAVAYGLDRASFNQCQNAKFDFTVAEDQQPTMTARGPGAVCCTTGSFTQATEEVAPTLMARDWKDPTVVCTQHYIVRRLTPVECARLQGFPDFWGDIEPKDDFTDDEYQFWLNVRNTHAAINGKTVKEYTKAQMLTWYNKLHTDSSEYKMWGNGIALPPALYCMQGITDVLNAKEG